MSHDEEVTKLYDEMENQIRLEKERILTEVSSVSVFIIIHFHRRDVFFNMKDL